MLQKVIASIDQLLSNQVNVIMHHARFQQLEASWRGLFYLTGKITRTDNVKIRVLNVSWLELAKDLRRSAEFDQTQLFIKVYTEEFGRPGGEPYGLLIGDYQVSHRVTQYKTTNDVEVLRGIMDVAAAAFAPFITAVDAAVFGLDSFTGLDRPLNLERTFQQAEYIQWKRLREEEDARFLGLVLPRVLMRLPYNEQNSYKKKFYFEEAMRSHSDYLWGNAAYCFGAVVIRTFLQSGWLADIRGVSSDLAGGGIVNDIPRHYFNTDSVYINAKYTTDVCMTSKQEKNFSDWGFISLCECKYTQLNVFYSCQSVQRPKQYDTAVVNVNAQISTMLQYILCASRFAHYIKVLIRDKVGTFASANEYESYLQDWIWRYTASSNDLTAEMRAKYPLREAKIKVHEKIGKPGSYVCTLHLAPHYQLDQIQTLLQMNTELL